MPLSAKKAGASYSGVRVPRAPLVTCLTCPLCANLFREATTISECLHTFCRECIQSQLSDGETNSCPKCNVSLGTLPLEKLRADHQLDDVKAKLFPDISKKRKNGPVSTTAISATPTRRKERSLSSLGINAKPLSGNIGLATRMTRGTPGKSVAGRNSSSSEDEENAEDGDEEEEGASLQHVRGAVDVGLEIAEKGDITKHLSSKEDEPKKLSARDGTGASSDLGLYLAQRSIISANGGFSRTRSGNISEQVAAADDCLGTRSRTQASPKEVGMLEFEKDFPLLTLAEVADADASWAVLQSRVEQSPPNPPMQSNASPDLPRGRDSVGNGAKVTDNSRPSTSQMLGGLAVVHMSPKAKRSCSQLQRNPSLKLFMNGGIERPAILKHPAPVATNGSNLASTSWGQGSSCGIWFALQAAQNQADNPLPQLTSPYLRIKDGKLPVSHVKKYLVKKLGLGHETEVEITCRGQPVVSSLPLESVRNIWFATATLPNPKERDPQGQANGSTGFMQLDTTSAKELIMVLTYQRHRRNSRVC